MRLSPSRPGPSTPRAPQHLAGPRQSAVREPLGKRHVEPARRSALRSKSSPTEVAEGHRRSMGGTTRDYVWSASLVVSFPSTARPPTEPYPDRPGLRCAERPFSVDPAWLPRKTSIYPGLTGSDPAGSRTRRAALPAADTSPVVPNAPGTALCTGNGHEKTCRRSLTCRHTPTYGHGVAGDVFGALANPVRREILEVLRGGPRAASDLASLFVQGRPAISEHLQVLRRAGLVREEPRGRHRFYHLEPVPLAAVDSWLHPFERCWRKQMRALSDLHQKEREWQNR